MPNNNTKNVFVPGVKVTGLALWAPSGTTVPTNANTALASAFVNLGYITDDWYKLSPDKSGGDAIKAAGGDTIVHSATTIDYTMTLNCAELNMQVAKVAAGTANVTGTETEYSVAHKSAGGDSGVLVLEMTLGEDGLRRVVVPIANASLDGDESPSNDNPLTTSIGITMDADINGVAYYEYIKKPTAA